MEAVSAQGSHYFSDDASVPERRRRLTVTLAGQPREVTTASGIFSPDGLDKGTAAFFSAVPAPPATGRFLDVGAGWGPMTLTLALASPQAHVTAVEVNDRAAALCRENAAALGAGNVQVLRPEQVEADAQFDLIWSNPPIRIGKPALHALLERWLPALAPGGQARLVVQKNLGADSLLPWMQDMLDAHTPGAFAARRADTVKGFRILHVQRAA
ncbi:MAG: methyltransferase [Micrococcus sp.]|nr:methyltransferase [Micrococcus sp.]